MGNNVIISWSTIVLPLRDEKEIDFFSFNRSYCGNFVSSNTNVVDPVSIRALILSTPIVSSTIGSDLCGLLYENLTVPHLQHFPPPLQYDQLPYSYSDF